MYLLGHGIGHGSVCRCESQLPVRDLCLVPGPQLQSDHVVHVEHDGVVVTGVGETESLKIFY